MDEMRFRRAVDFIEQGRWNHGIVVECFGTTKSDPG